MASTTDRIKKTVEALDQKQIKKALYLTDKKKLERHHEWVESAARTCLEHKDDPKICEAAIKVARDRVKGTITLAMDSVDLEGIEEYLNEEAPVVTEQEEKRPTSEMSDEELYAHCDVCHVSNAVVQVVGIADKDECDGKEVMAKLQPCLDDENTTPETWIKTMTEVAEKATCHQPEYVQVLSELSEYLQNEDSPILENLDKPEE